MVNNSEIAKIFNQIADILEVKAENIFRIRAYRRAAQSIEALAEDVTDVAQRNELTRIPGIGSDLAGKIAEYIKTGKIKFFDELKKQVPRGFLELMTIPGVGPKKARILADKLKIKDIKDLEKKAKAHKLSNLPGMKEKTEENILKGIQIVKKGKEQVPLGVALPLAEKIAYRLKGAGDNQAAVCGSLRRRKETVRDIDILVASSDPEKVMDTFAKLPFVKRMLAHGPTKSSAIVQEGIQVDIRAVEPKSFGSALLYFTGSKEHNIRIRELAVKKGLKINEYGIFDVKTGERLGGRTEEEMYKVLGLAYIPPELREDMGEIEKAFKGALPRLIEADDIRGDFHVHTEASDGSNSLEELADAARKKGYEYIAITDHSKTLAIAGGLKDRELLDQIKRIRSINKKLKGFRFLASAEVDILEDGSLGFKDEILAQLDIVIAAAHSGFKQPKEKLTARIIRAMENKYVNIIAHMTSRLMGTRDAYPLDMEEIFKAAKDTNTALEINAFPLRLDLDDINTRKAKEAGVMFAIGTDTHSIDQLENMRYGLSVARRSWLEKRDVLNTFTAAEALKKIKKG